MKAKKYWILVIILFALLGCSKKDYSTQEDTNINPTGETSAAVSAETISMTLDSGWRFYRGIQAGAYETGYDDSNWKSITVPHTWNTDLIKNQEDKDHYKGDGWYRLHLPLKEKMKGRRLFLRFEGALAVADVFLNGKKVGQHVGGYTAFCFEITNLINWGSDNILAVKVNNEDNPAMIPSNERLFTLFGGIYRPVTLLVKDQTCITPLDYASSGVYILQDKVTDQKADLTVKTKLTNALSNAACLNVTVAVHDATNNIVSQKSESLNIPSGQTLPVAEKITILSPHLWNGRKDPYLYRVKICVRRDGIVVDEISEPLGLRYYHVDADKGFFLNGKHYDLYGICRHQEWEHEGSALTDEHHRKDVEFIMEIGATALRLAHYPQSATMYRLCNSNGLVVWAEIPVVQGTNPNEPDTFDNAKQQLIEMIRQNYNNPSICFWGLYNECLIDPNNVRILHDMAKKEDPGRLTVAASDARLSEKHFVTDVICWNQYPMWYSKLKIDQWSDQLHTKNPELKFGISEFGAGGCIDQHAIPPEQPHPTEGRFFAEEYQSLVHETIWPKLNERPFLWGNFIWNMFDFSWPGATRGNRINLNHKGLITYDRKVKKDSFFYYKANWSDEPVLYITSRRFVKRTNPVTEIKVYSNCDNVELTLNGKTYPSPKGSYCVYVWPEMKLAEGENIVKVKAVKDGKTVTDSCIWNLKSEV